MIEEEATNENERDGQTDRVETSCVRCPRPRVPDTDATKSTN